MRLQRTAYDVNTGVSNSKIDINRKTITGPIRGAPHTDYEYFTKGMSELTNRIMPLQFGEVINDLDASNLRELVNTRDATSKLSSFFSTRARKINDLTISIPRVDDDVPISRLHMSELVKAQADAQLDVITVPDAKIKSIDTSWKYVMESGIKDADQLIANNQHDVVMPIIDLNQRHQVVTAKVEYLLDLGVDIQAIAFRPSGSFGPKLKRVIPMIREHREEEIREMWVHFTNVHPKMKFLSHTHISVLGKIDTFSTRKITAKQAQYLSMSSRNDPSQADFDVPTEPPRTTSTPSTSSTSTNRRSSRPRNDLLNASELIYQNDFQHLNQVQSGNICNCPMHRIYSNYASLTNMLNSDDRKKFVTVHDLYTSKQQFDVIQQDVINQDLLNYYRVKPAVVNIADDINRKFGVQI